MRKIICGIVLICAGTSFSSAQDNQLLASVASLHEFKSSGKEAPVGLVEKERSLVLLPELHADAKLVLDSVFGFAAPTGPKQVKPLSFILPGALMAAGTYSLFNEDLKDFNRYTRDNFGNNKVMHGFVPDHVTMFLPFAAYYGIRLAGVKGRSSVGDASLKYFMASAINNSVIFVVKNRSAIERPDASDLLSFPSGHTAQAFVSAEFLRMEYGHLSPWYGVAGYAAAVGTGILRMRHNKHWFNDVVAGAGVGILSTRLTYWLYPKLKKLVMPNAKSDMMLAPVYANGNYGLSFMYRFN